MSSEAGTDPRLEDAPEDPRERAFARAGQHDDAAGYEHARVRGQRTAAGDVEEHVVALTAPREVLFRVVDDQVGADRADQLHVARLAHRRDVRADLLPALYRDRAHAPGRAIDEDALPGPDLADVTRSEEHTSELQSPD